MHEREDREGPQWTAIVWGSKDTAGGVVAT